MKTIYLSGTIYEEKRYSLWKDRFINCLKNDNLIKDEHYKVIIPKLIDNCPEYMVALDKRNIDISNIFLAFIAKFSVGTSMEIFYAYQKQSMPIFIIDPLGICKNNIWITAHSHCIFKDVPEAAITVKEIINENK